MISMRLIKLSKRFSTYNLKQTQNTKTNLGNIPKNINFDNSFNSISFILKKIDDSENKQFKKLISQVNLSKKGTSKKRIGQQKYRYFRARIFTIM